MKIAIPVKAGRLESHFGHAREFAFVTVDDGSITTSETLDAPTEHGSLPGWLIQHRVDLAIVGGLGQAAIDRLSAGGIEVHAGAPALTPEELVRGRLAGTLPMKMQACSHHGQGDGPGHGHGGGCGKHD